MSPQRNKNIAFLLVVLGAVVIVIWGVSFLFPKKRLPVRPRPVKVVKVVPPPEPVKVPQKPQGVIAIVLDDWGYNRSHCRQLEALTVPAGVAILPHLTYSQDIITCAAQAGKEPMLHLPIEPHSAKESFTKEYDLTTDLSPAEIKKKLVLILKEMSGVVGVNNHTGSKGTEDEQLVTVVLSELKRRGLFFIDSRTSERSVCGDVAAKLKMRIGKRDVFLDNRNDRVSIEKQIAWTARIARENGHALMIGHDRALTLQILIEQTKKLQEQGYEFVPVKEYIRRYEYSGN